VLRRLSIRLEHGCSVSRNLAIAVIDDDDSFRLALVESLSSLGYASCGYASAEDYVGSIRDKSFDCVVTDIHMPGMSGLDLLKCRATQGWGMPVISITARSDSNLEVQAAASGAVCLFRNIRRLANPERLASLGSQTIGVEQQKASNKTSNRTSNTKNSRRPN
jgi:FixJ family two-component response regulator